MFADLISLELMDYVGNAQQELHTINKNRFVMHCVLELMKFTMVEIVFVPIIFSGSMEFAHNVQLVHHTTVPPKLVYRFVRSMNHLMVQLVYVHLDSTE